VEKVRKAAAQAASGRQWNQRIITLEYDEVMRTFALSALGAAALAICPVLVRSAPQPQTTTSVWDGVFTVEQAKRGAAVYANACASCHGDQMEGEGQAPPLSGSDFTSKWNKQVVDDLFEIVKASMPADKPGSLTAAQNADVLAYIFQANQYPAGKTELPSDADGLKKIRIEAKK
jgi:mono/diheme cytochrome c family protein